MTDKKPVKTGIGIYPMCKGKNCTATNGFDHSIECQIEQDECYKEDDLDRAARRRYIMQHGSEN